METITIRHLKSHPAQMRTTHDLDALATLTLQIYERGLDSWQPIVAAQNGQAHHIISGHRRHMAQLLAFALGDWAQEHADTEITIEVVRTMLSTLVNSLGSLEQLIASLLEKYGDHEISFVPFAGSQKAEILALQAANYGREQPDMLGVAHSFREALTAGATPEEIARNAGQHVRYVQNHLALTEIPPELAQHIAAGELPMSVATAVADLPEPKRSGLAIFILANASADTAQAGQLTAKAIKACAATLKKWPGLQMPLMVKHQSQRNIARALVRLWGQVVEAYPEDAYAAAAMFIYRDLHMEPWSAQEKLTLWFQALGGDTYFTDSHFDKVRTGGINWPAIVEYLLPEVSCETCPIAQLPRQQLRADLAQGQGGPLGMPCRVVETDPTPESWQTKRCIHGLTAADPFDCRVPWAWSEHPGVVHEGGEYRVKRYEHLLQAWQAQAAKEQAEDEAEKAVAQTTVEDHKAAADNDETAPAGNEPSATPAPTPPANNPGEGKESAIVKQRALITDFMARVSRPEQKEFAVNHPLATPCRHCRHRLDSSPTKDESVPHCTWAGRLRRVVFRVLEPEDKQAPRIPECRQFAPSQPWQELIPTHPSPPEMPRDWVKAQILLLVEDANRHGANRNVFEFLTGRPLGATETYHNWFSQQLAAQGGDLSDAQLFTLFVWAHTEWQRARRSPFSVPVNGKSMQFATYHERPWRIKEAT